MITIGFFESLNNQLQTIDFLSKLSIIETVQHPESAAPGCSQLKGVEPEQSGYPLFVLGATPLTNCIPGVITSGALYLYYPMEL